MGKKISKESLEEIHEFWCCDSIIDNHIASCFHSYPTCHHDSLSYNNAFDDEAWACIKNPPFLQADGLRLRLPSGTKLLLIANFGQYLHFFIVLNNIWMQILIVFTCNANSIKLCERGDSSPSECIKVYIQVWVLKSDQGEFLEGSNCIKIDSHNK